MFITPKTGWIGVDIGLASVKLAQLVRRDGRLVLGAAASADRTSLSSNQPAQTKASLLPFTSQFEIARAALIGRRWRGKSAAVAASMSLCDVSQSALPGNLNRLKPEELEQEFQKTAPSPLAARQSAWWPAASAQDAPRHAMMATIPTAWADQMTRDVSANRWQCRTIDALPWCLSRAIDLVENEGHFGNHSSGLVAALDWGYSKTTLCLLRDGVPVQVRNLKDCGFEHLLQAISQGLGASPKDARRLLAETRLGNSAAAEQSQKDKILARFVQPAIVKLEKELQRTLQFWESQTRGEQLRSVYLFGGGAALLGIAERLTNTLEMPCGVWDFPRASTADDAPPTCLFGAAVGLSALAWEKS